MHILSTCIIFGIVIFFTSPLVGSDDRIRITPTMQLFFTTAIKQTIQQSQHKKHDQQKIETITLMLEQQFAEKILKVYCATKWEMTSRAESYFLVKNFTSRFIGSDTTPLPKKLHDFIKKEVMTRIKLDIAPIRIERDICRLDTLYIGDTVVWPAIILINPININRAAYAISFKFDNNYKFVYMVTPQKKQLCFLLKKKNATRIEPHM